PANAVVVGTPGTCTSGSGATLDCALGDITAGDVISGHVIVAIPAPGTVAASVAVAATEADPVSANNTASVSTVVSYEPIVIGVAENLTVNDDVEVVPPIVI